MIRITLIFLSIGMANLASIAYAHGEDAPGPNKGYIKMPGVFHTELTPVNGSEFNIFLLDIAFKNPLIEKSSVNAVLKQKNIITHAKCVASGNHFNCKLPKDVKLDSGQLEIKASRNGAVGGTATYKLPFGMSK